MDCSGKSKSFQQKNEKCYHQPLTDDAVMLYVYRYTFYKKKCYTKLNFAIEDSVEENIYRLYLNMCHACVEYIFIGMYVYLLV